MTSCGRISLLTTLSASSSFMLASRPSASAALCEIEGTLSNSSGRSRLMTPADCSASMFWGRVASSAMVCTKVTRAFWYCSKGWSTALLIPYQLYFYIHL
jgi:hypothetical protein